jgi:hypothetical protein
LVATIRARKKATSTTTAAIAASRRPTKRKERMTDGGMAISPDYETLF